MYIGRVDWRGRLEGEGGAQFSYNKLLNHNREFLAKICEFFLQKAFDSFSARSRSQQLNVY